jgi:hypothetical protein
MINEKFIDAWPSPILTGEVENKQIIDDVIQHILENYNLERPPGEINDQNIFEDQSFNDFKNQIVIPAFDHWLKTHIKKEITEFKSYKMRAWITGAHAGYSMTTHNHSGAHLSAVFYLINDAPDAGGEIVLFDPRFNANRSYEADWREFFAPMKLKTPSYTFAVFPSFVYHQVTNFSGTMRLAIPVDIFL